MPYVKGTPFERFVDRITEQGDCWLFGGADNGKGYVRFEGTYAHRWSWEFHNGPIPRGLLVLHKCDTPNCVNPEHLWLGTYQDNVDDMMAKGRGCVGEPRRAATRRGAIRGDDHWTRREPERVAVGGDHWKNRWGS